MTTKKQDDEIRQLQKVEREGPIKVRWETEEEIWNKKYRLTNISNTGGKKWWEKTDLDHIQVKWKTRSKLHADPTHLVHLSRSLSSTTLKKQPAHMKIVQVIKVWRGSCPSHPQPADSAQTDKEPARRCHSWMESEWRQDEKKMKKKGEAKDPWQQNTLV